MVLSVSFPSDNRNPPSSHSFIHSFAPHALMGNEFQPSLEPGSSRRKKVARGHPKPLGADEPKTEVVWCGQLISCLPFSEGDPETSSLGISGTILFFSPGLLKHLRCALEHDQGQVPSRVNEDRTDWCLYVLHREKRLPTFRWAHRNLLSQLPLQLGMSM